MLKKFWVGLVVALLVASLSGLVYAADAIQLIVNGKLIETGEPSELKNGTTMAPVRAVAEALGADVKWDDERQAVLIRTDDTGLKEQLALLQQGYAAATPQEAAQTWANAVKNRNGAVQFAVLSPEMKEKARPHYESIHWVTGISSPYVSEVYVSEGQQMDDKTWEFEIEFQMKTSTGNAGLKAATLQVGETDGHWYITQVLGGTEGVPNFPPADIHTEDEAVRSVMDKMKLGASMEEVKRLYGDGYVEVDAALDGGLMWRYDTVAREGYAFEGDLLDGERSDSVDLDGLGNGSMRLQLFVGWANDGKAESYSLYYKGNDGKTYDYRLYGDGKLSIRALSQ